MNEHENIDLREFLKLIKEEIPGIDPKLIGPVIVALTQRLLNRRSTNGNA